MEIENCNELSNELLSFYELVKSLKRKTTTLFLKGNLEESVEAYCQVLELDPTDSLKFTREGDCEKIILGSQLPRKFLSKYEDFEFQKKLIQELAQNLRVPIEEKMFGPINGYKEFWSLLKRSWRKKEWSGIATYSFALLTGLIPPYADFIDKDNDNHLDKIYVRPAGFSISPLSPLLAFSSFGATIYGVSLIAHHGLMHGFYNGTKRGRFRMLGHEYTHFYQMLTVQRMYNDGLCSNVKGFLDQAYNELEALTFGKFAVAKDLKEATPGLIKEVLDYEKKVHSEIT